MNDVPEQLDDLRLDIKTLRTMIDVALDRGVTGDDALLKACAQVLTQRQARLEQLEAALGNQPPSSSG